LILHSQPYRETDELVTVYSRDFGKLAVLARGIKKSASHLAPHLLPTRECSLAWVFGRQFPILTDAALLGRHATPSWVRLNYALHAAHLTDRALVEPIAVPTLYEALRRAFLLFWELRPRSERKEEILSAVLLAHGAFTLLGALGRAPDLGQCISCRKPLSGRIGISLHEGGCMHERCTDTQRSWIPLTPHTHAIVRAIGSGKIVDPDAFKDGDEVQEVCALACALVAMAQGEEPSPAILFSERIMIYPVR
ncbi:MAG: DNA repair protein RecO, partial [Parcubacteria group bacterium]|nr:DNA repair protein RecO [Parcubacteria group bacterium]